ncbi:adenosine-deaminase domain-containing protein, partial [Aureobasidium melanogenum]
MAGNEFAHADAIADCVLAAFDALPAHRKPRLPSSGLKAGRREWVPLAGIVLENSHGALTCAALATGMKCLPRDKIQSLNGNVVHDSHAEILALRAFNRFLLDQSALLYADPSADNLLRPSSTQKPFTIDPQITIHMYCSEAPCGDASMELTMAQQDDQSPWTSTSDVESDELFGRGYFGTLGVVRRKPARPDAPPTLSKSCSDKLALKQYTSVLSAVSSLLIHPENAYIHTLVMPQSQMVSEACARAFGRHGRLSALENAPSGPFAFRPFAVRPTTREFSFSRRIVDPSTTSIVPSNISSLTKAIREELLPSLDVQCGPWLLNAKSYADIKASQMLSDREAAKQTAKDLSLQGWKRNTGDDEWSLSVPKSPLVCTLQYGTRTGWCTAINIYVVYDPLSWPDCFIEDRVTTLRQTQFEQIGTNSIQNLVELKTREAIRLATHTIPSIDHPNHCASPFKGQEELTSIDTDHTSLEILKQPPSPINILGKEVTSQSHTSVVRSLHRLFLSIKSKHSKHRRKGLFTRNQHFRMPREVVTGPRVVLDSLPWPITRSLVFWTIRSVNSFAMSAVIDLLVICILEHEERAVASKLERHFLQSIRTDLGYQFAHTSAACEGDLLYKLMSTQGFGQRWSVVKTSGQNIEHTRREACLKSQPAARAAPALRRIIAMGKFHGVNATATPTACLMVKTRRPGAAGVETVPWILSASPANHLSKAHQQAVCQSHRSQSLQCPLSGAVAHVLPVPGSGFHKLVTWDLASL